MLFTIILHVLPPNPDAEIVRRRPVPTEIDVPCGRKRRKSEGQREKFYWCNISMNIQREETSDLDQL